MILHDSLGLGKVCQDFGLLGSYNIPIYERETTEIFKIIFLPERALIFL